MKFLHVINTLDPRNGGPVEGVRLIGTELEKQGDYQVEVATLDAPEAPWLVDFPLKTHALGPSWLKYGFAPRFTPWLRAHRRDYDAVIVNGIWQYSSFGAWRALCGTDTPYFVFTHGMLDPWFKRRFPFKHLKKWLYWPWSDYRVLHDARAVCFTCEEERVLAGQTFWLYRCREKVVGYGTRGPTGDATAQKQRFFERFPQFRDRHILLFLGRLHEKKGPDLLIQAFRRLTECGAKADGDGRALALLMAGPASSPEYQQELETLAGEMLATTGPAGLEKSMVFFPGMLEGDLKWGALHAAEAFALPSHQENFGIAVVEALACGTPVLISDRVNIWREIQETHGGLVEPDDLIGTVRLLSRWMSFPAQERAQMRNRAVQCFAAHFEIGQAARNLAQVMEGRAEGDRSAKRNPNPVSVA